MSRTVNLQIKTPDGLSDNMDIAYFQEEVILRVVRNARAAVMTAGNKFPENVSYNGKLGTDVVYMSYNTKIVKTALIDAAQNIEGVTVL